MIKHIKIDRDKLLDEAIFMLLEARRKCHEGFSPTAIDRLDLAIDKSKKVVDYLNDSFDSSNYPTAQKLIEDNIISKQSNGKPEVGDPVGFHINYGRQGGVDTLTGLVKEIIKTPNDIDDEFVYTYKITYYRNDRKNTVTRSPKDLIFFGD